MAKDKKQRSKKKMKKDSAYVLVKRAIEYKYDDLVFNNAAYGDAGATPVANSISAVAEGDTSVTRNGLKITPTSILVDLYSRIHVAGSPAQPAGPPVMCRIVIVRDTQQVDSTVPQWSEIFDAALTMPNVLKPKSRQKNRNRFQFLMDKQFTLDTFGKGTYHLRKYMKLDPKYSIHYSADTASSINKNGLYLFLASNAIIGEVPYIWGNVRLRYADI